MGKDQEDKTEQGLMLVTPEVFTLVQDLAYKSFGFELPIEKRTMVTRRLSRLAVELGASGPNDVVRRFLVRPTPEVLRKLANCLTTNHTYFHREPQHFDRLSSEILPRFVKTLEKNRDLRIWCAAASSGQEPYEIAMWVRIALGLGFSQWKTGVLASDISEDILAEAKAGIYSEEQVSALPVSLQRQFVEHRNGKYYMSKKIRGDLTFRRFNLMSQVYPFKRPFHMIFCRNVMIYFDDKTRRSVIDKLIGCLEIGGYLFIGRSESARGFDGKLRFIEAGLYQREP